MPQTQDSSLDALHDMIRTAKPGTTLIAAPDVYDRLVPDRIPGAEYIWGLCGRHDVQIRCSSAVEAGKVIVMASTTLRYLALSAPKKDWISGFLNKSGPVSDGTMLPHTKKYVSPVAPKPPRPPSPPKPPSPPRPPQPRPRPRQRIVDT